MLFTPWATEFITIIRAYDAHFTGCKDYPLMTVGLCRHQEPGRKGRRKRLQTHISHIGWPDSEKKVQGATCDPGLPATMLRTRLQHSPWPQRPGVPWPVEIRLPGATAWGWHRYGGIFCAEPRSSKHSGKKCHAESSFQQLRNRNFQKIQPMFNHTTCVISQSFAFITAFPGCSLRDERALSFAQHGPKESTRC